MSRVLATLDFETTGVNPHECRPVSVAFNVLRANGQPVDTHRVVEVIDCGVAVPAEAAAIHGLTTERVRELGKPPELVLPLVLAKLARCADTGVAVVIYNAPFDWTLLHHEAEKLNLAVPACWLVDPLVLDRHLDKWRKGKRTLAAVCEARGVLLTGAHDAEADGIAAGRLAQLLLRDPSLASKEPREVHTVQVEAFEVWRDGFAAYLRNQGKPDAELETRTWPGGLRAGVTV